MSEKQYIEREAAYRFAQDQMRKETGAYSKGWNNALNVMKSAFHNNDAIPATEVVEVRHGRWDLAKDPFGAGYVKCSRCGYKHCPEYYPDGSAIMHFFCPNCGAKMDGKEENNAVD